jgi:hypothetical protein
MLAALMAGLLAPMPAQAGKAHEHGVARADIGVEAGRITLRLELPLDDLVGFERPPRTEAERTAVAQALGKLQEAAQVVRIDAAGGCGAARVELLAPVWGVGGPASGVPAKGGAAHADMQVTYEFRCGSVERAGHLELGLFEAFARIRRVEVQAVAPKGQMKLVLRRPNTRVALAR